MDVETRAFLQRAAADLKSIAGDLGKNQQQRARDLQRLSEVGSLADEFERAQHPKSNDPEELRRFYLLANHFPLREEQQRLSAQITQPLLTIREIQKGLVDALLRAAVSDPACRFVLERLERCFAESPGIDSLSETITLLEGLTLPSTLVASHDPIQSAAKASEQTSATADSETLLGDKDAVTYQTAATFLTVGLRQIRKLVQSGVLITVGKGQNKKITSESLRAYKLN